MVKKILLRLGLVCAGLVAALLVFEVYARYKYNPSFAYIPTLYDAVIGHRLIPSWEGWDEKEDYKIWVKTNSWGFRDEEFDTAKPAGKKRVAVLGDSFMFGAGCPQDQLFSRHLDRRLNEAGIPAQVMNFGVKAYGPDQYLISFENQVRATKPDVVVVSLLQFNDPENMVSALGKPRYFVDSGGKLFYQAPPPEPIARPEQDEPTLLGKFKKYFLRRHSAGYQWARHYVRNIRIDWGYALHKIGLVDDDPRANLLLYTPYYTAAQDSPKVNEAYAVLKAAMARFQALAKEDGFQLFVVLVPTPEVVEDGKWQEWETMIHKVIDPAIALDRDVSRRRMAALASELGIPHLDLTEPFRLEQKSRPDEPLYLVIDGHWNAHGHEAGGKMIAEWILQNLKTTKSR